MEDLENKYSQLDLPLSLPPPQDLPSLDLRQSEGDSDRQGDDEEEEEEESSGSEGVKEVEKLSGPIIADLGGTGDLPWAERLKRYLLTSFLLFILLTIFIFSSFLFVLGLCLGPSRQPSRISKTWTCIGEGGKGR